jgi:hypothetical protein
MFLLAQLLRTGSGRSSFLRFHGIRVIVGCMSKLQAHTDIVFRSVSLLNVLLNGTCYAPSFELLEAGAIPAVVKVLGDVESICALPSIEFVAKLAVRSHAGRSLLVSEGVLEPLLQVILGPYLHYTSVVFLVNS